MHAPQRRFEPAVIERLFQEPYRFEYFQAVRLLELWFKRQGASGHGLAANFLRFQNSTSLGFPASQLAAVDTEPRELARDAGSLGAALASGALKYVRITPSFMGLLGSTGVLPSHYTERIAAHQMYQKDDGPRAFIDTYSNRSLALFYEAWRKYRLALKYQRDGADTFLPLLLSLAGLGIGALRQRLADDMGGAVLDESIGYFAAAIRHRPASASQIARVLSEYFGQAVTAEQFIGCWYDVPSGQQTMLGGANATLGVGAMVGERVWQRDLRLRLVVGPLDGAGYSAFLPGGLAARALTSMVGMFTGVALEYEVELMLSGAYVHGVSLDQNAGGRRLGWDTYLVAGPQSSDRRDVRYEISPMAPDVTR